MISPASQERLVVICRLWLEGGGRARPGTLKDPGPRQLGWCFLSLRTGFPQPTWKNRVTPSGQNRCFVQEPP